MENKNKKWFLSFEILINELNMSLKSIINSFLFIVFPMQLFIASLIYYFNIIDNNLKKNLSIVWTYCSNFSTYFFSNSSIIEQTNKLLLDTTIYLLKDIGIYFLASSIIYPIILPILYKKVKNKSNAIHEKKYIRGAKILSVDDMKKETKNLETNFKLGEIDIPKKIETEHILIIGSSGSGKTQLLKRPILKALNDNSKKGIIHDIKGDWISEFYDREKHFIFNPIDKRSLKWNIFNDIHNVFDIKNFCAWLIPDNPKANDPFWNDSARLILESILLYLFSEDKKSNYELKRLLLMENKDLKILLENYGKGAMLLEKKDSFLTLQTKMSFIDFLEDGDFSFKEWIHKGKGFIFLSNIEETEAIMKPVLTLAINVLASETLKLDDDLNRRIYFFLDEFTSLHKLEKIISLLKLGRSKGASVWLAFQDFQQLEKIYNREDMRTVINNSATTCVLRLKEPESAEYFAKRFGKQEYKIKTETISTGIAINRDGFSYSEQIKDDFVVKDSEILNLPNLTLFIAISNIEGVCKTKIEILVNTSIKNNSFEMKELDINEQIKLLSKNSIKDNILSKPLKMIEEENLFLEKDQNNKTLNKIKKDSNEISDCFREILKGD